MHQALPVPLQMPQREEISTRYVYTYIRMLLTMDVSKTLGRGGEMNWHEHFNLHPFSFIDKMHACDVSHRLQSRSYLNTQLVLSNYRSSYHHTLSHTTANWTNNVQTHARTYVRVFRMGEHEGSKDPQSANKVQSNPNPDPRTLHICSPSH